MRGDRATKLQSLELNKANMKSAKAARLLFTVPCVTAASRVGTLPLNRPATAEGSEGKGAWCERCWATDTGPQKESDVTGSRKGDKGGGKKRENEKKKESK